METHSRLAGRKVKKVVMETKSLTLLRDFLPKAFVNAIQEKVDDDISHKKLTKSQSGSSLGSSGSFCSRCKPEAIFRIKNGGVDNCLSTVSVITDPGMEVASKIRISKRLRMQNEKQEELNVILRKVKEALNHSDTCKEDVKEYREFTISDILKKKERQMERSGIAKTFDASKSLSMSRDEIISDVHAWLLETKTNLESFCINQDKTECVLTEEQFHRRNKSLRKISDILNRLPNFKDLCASRNRKRHPNSNQNRNGNDNVEICESEEEQTQLLQKIFTEKELNEWATIQKVLNFLYMVLKDGYKLATKKQSSKKMKKNFFTLHEQMKILENVIKKKLENVSNLENALKQTNLELAGTTHLRDVKQATDLSRIDELNKQLEDVRYEVVYLNDQLETTKDQLELCRSQRTKNEESHKETIFSGSLGIKLAVSQDQDFFSEKRETGPQRIGSHSAKEQLNQKISILSLSSNRSQLTDNIKSVSQISIGKNSQTYETSTKTVIQSPSSGDCQVKENKTSTPSTGRNRPKISHKNHKANLVSEQSDDNTDYARKDDVQNNNEDNEINLKDLKRERDKNKNLLLSMEKLQSEIKVLKDRERLFSKGPFSENVITVMQHNHQKDLQRLHYHIAKEEQRFQANLRKVNFDHQNYVSGLKQAKEQMFRYLAKFRKHFNAFLSKDSDQTSSPTPENAAINLDIFSDETGDLISSSFLAETLTSLEKSLNKALQMKRFNEKEIAIYKQNAQKIIKGYNKHLEEVTDKVDKQHQVTKRTLKLSKAVAEHRDKLLLEKELLHKELILSKTPYEGDVVMKGDNQLTPVIDRTIALKGKSSTESRDHIEIMSPRVEIKRIRYDKTDDCLKPIDRAVSCEDKKLLVQNAFQWDRISSEKQHTAINILEKTHTIIINQLRHLIQRYIQLQRFLTIKKNVLLMQGVHLNKLLANKYLDQIEERDYEDHERWMKRKAKLNESKNRSLLHFKAFLQNQQIPDLEIKSKHSQLKKNETFKQDKTSHVKRLPDIFEGSETLKELVGKCITTRSSSQTFWNVRPASPNGDVYITTPKLLEMDINKWEKDWMTYKARKSRITRLPPIVSLFP